MATKSSDTLSCNCKEDKIDLSEIEQIIEGVIKNLKLINKDLHQNVLKSCGDNATTRSCKLQTLLLHLISNDIILQKLLETLNGVEPLKDDCITNFGMSVKVEMARKKLTTAKIKHETLRTEWYSQDKHLNCLANKVETKDEELERQSIFCTTQGLVLSTIVWKASQSNELLDFIVSHQAQILELIKILDGCLYGFTQTYKNEMPEPSAEEYQYVLSLCGILVNLAAVPDGRFVLCDHEVSQRIFTQIIKMLPNILVPNAEGLKWIMLSAIYNIMICRKGEKLIKNNKEVVKAISSCTLPPHANRIIILALKIISKLTDEIPNQAYLQHVSDSLPVKHFKTLQNTKDSLTIRKQAKKIVCSVSRMFEYYRNLGEGKMTASTSVNKAKLKYKCASHEKQKPSVMAYYVFTDTTKSSGGETYDSVHTSYSSTATGTSKSSLTNDTYPSSSDEDISTNQIKHIKSWAHNDMGTSHLCNSNENASPIQPSTCQKQVQHHIFQTAPSSNDNFTNPNTAVSTEIQTIPYQEVNLNQNNEIPATIGDTSEIIALPDIHRTVRVTEQPRNEFNVTSASTITVFRANNTIALAASSNSFTEFVNGIGTSTSFPATVSHVVGSTALTHRETNSPSVDAEEQVQLTVILNKTEQNGTV